MKSFSFKPYGLAFILFLLLFSFGCENAEDPDPETSPIDDIGTLIANSNGFTQFARLIEIADQEVPNGELSISDMLSESTLDFEITVFAPSDVVFESLAVQWSSPDYQVSVTDVIAEFTHNGQPEKTRDFVLGHIFKSQNRFDFSAFSTELFLESEKGIRWQMVEAADATSGFGFVLENNPNSNPYYIYETDVLTGSNGVVHAALVN